MKKQNIFTSHEVATHKRYSHDMLKLTLDDGVTSEKSRRVYVAAALVARWLRRLSPHGVSLPSGI